MLTLFNELARVIKVQLQTIHLMLVLLIIYMPNTVTFIEQSMVPDIEDAVHGHVSDTSPLPSERGETSIIFEYEVSFFSDVEAAVTPASDIVCNSGFNIGDIVVEHNETEDEEEIIAWFLKGGCLCKLLDCTLFST